MAGNNVDWLSIEVTSDVSKAVSGIKSLAKAMEALERSVERSSVGKASSSITGLASAIGKLGGSNVESAIKNMPHLARELNNMMTVLSKSPAVKGNIVQMTQALAKLASQGQKVATATNALANGMNKNTSPGMRTASTSGNQLSRVLKNINSQNVKLCSSIDVLRKGISFVNPQRLLRPLMQISGVIGTIYTSCFMFFGLFRKMKDAIAYAADLTEVQHVVDVQFGNMKDKLEDFTKTSIKDFGINELSAKSYASVFQSMGNAIGITGAQVAGAQKHLSQFKTPYGAVNGYNELSNSMADMSINLTKLTADISSFYNVNQDEVAKSLQSGIFAGQSRPLRRFGVDLTQATLQEWALTNGIKANFKTMTQAEKTMLRYAYTMERLGVAQGDYAYTSKTWANQVRLLKQQFQQLGAIIGQGLIQWLKPFLIGMNQVLSRVVEFAKKVVNALGKIFGWEVEIGAGALDTDLDEAVGDVTDLGNAVDSTTDSVKELNKQVQGFDKLNILTTNKNNKNPSSGAGTGTSGAGASGGNSDVTTQLKQTTGLFESEIDNLYELGEKIRDALIRAMDNIDWDSIYKKAANFGKGLAEFLNGLFSNDKEGNNVFSKTGETIAKALGAALTAINEFATNFKWNDFGKNLASGFIKFAEKMDWGLSVETFKNLGTGLADALNGLFANDKDGNNIFKAVGKTLAGTLNTVIAGSLAFAEKFDWSMFGTNLASGLTEFLKDFDWSAAGKNFHKWMQGIKESFKSFVKYLTEHPEDILKAFTDFFSEITLEDIGILIGLMTIKKIGSWVLAGGVKELAETAISGLFRNAGIAISAKITGMSFVEASSAAGAGTLGASVGTSILSSLKSALSTAFTGAGLALIESTGAATAGGALLTLGVPVGFAITPIIGQAILTDIHKKAEEEGDKATKEIVEAAWGKKGTVTKDSEGKYHVSQDVGIDFKGTFNWIANGVTNFFTWLSNKLFPKNTNYKVNGKTISTNYTAAIDIGGTLKWAGGKIKSFLSWLAKAIFPDKKNYTVNGKKITATYTAGVDVGGALQWTGTKIKSFLSWLAGKIFPDKKNYKVNGKTISTTYTASINVGGTLKWIGTKLKSFLTWLAGALFPDKKNYKVNGKNISVSYNTSVNVGGVVKWIGEKIGNFTSWVREKIFGKGTKTSAVDVGTINGNAKINADVTLKKDGWSSVTSWVKEKLGDGSVNKPIGLTKLGGKDKNAWSGKSVGQWVGSAYNMGKTVPHTEIGLSRLNGKSKSAWAGKTVAGWINMHYNNTNPVSKVSLARAKSWEKKTITQYIADKWGGRSVMVPISLKEKSKKNFVWATESGGVFTGAGWKPVQGYATGGMPNTAEVFMARENGLPEMVGTIGGHTAVMNNDQIVASVSNGVARANAEQNELLRTQNALLRRILAKETGITSRDVFNACRSENNNYKNRTGKSAFAY